MNMPINEPVTVERDCNAILIPAGVHITLRKGSVVFIMQALGGNYTVNVNGNLAQVSARDADALGFNAPDQVSTRGDDTPENDGAVNEDLLWAQMRTCYDPEIPINIVDLGLIYQCKVVPLDGDGDGNRIEVVMTLTAPGCGMGEFLAEDVRSKLAQVPNVTDVDVQLTFDPPWSQEMMSEAARLETGLF